MFSTLVLTVVAAPLWAAPAEPDITLDMKAVEELMGGQAAAELSATLTPPKPQAEPQLFAPLADESSKEALARGATLQLLYARGNLVIAPSGRETLESWADNFLNPASRVEILSYSGNNNQAVTRDSLGDLQAYTLHEAIRTAFKRALVVRDILIEKGVPEANITLRALGPANDSGPAERIDVVALQQK